MADLLFFQPTVATHHRLPLPFPRSQPRHCRHRILLRSAPEERTMVADRELDLLNWNGNGRVLGPLDVVEESKNGGAEVLLKGNGASNGSLVKYAGENGAATVMAAADKGQEEGRRRKRVEEIAKEDAWFKKTGPEPQVSVVSGGRWNRFKTYSTIQRTMEIWGFVFAFAFKAWLNSQKFSYRGGMTEAKKALRRRGLAKWLKESILRLGPTFIKIGQQFSTRVDILAQEYIDQLSELQVQKLVDNMIHAPIIP